MKIIALNKDAPIVNIRFREHIDPGKNSKLRAFNHYSIDVVDKEKFGNGTQPVNIMRIVFTNKKLYEHWTKRITSP